MSTPSTSSPAPAPVDFITAVRKVVTPYLAPYYLFVAGVLGAMTAGLVALIVVIVLIATNFNVLGFVE